MNSTTKATHTPGPWHVSHSGYANAPFVIFAGTVTPNYAAKFPLSGVHVIAEVFHDESPDHEAQEANASAITAIPEMLKALRVFVNYMAHAGDISISRKSLAYPLHLAQAAIDLADGAQ